MSRLTPFFLVVLRLAIGWHVFFAGVEKVRAPNWSSEGYLREASGPLAPQFRELAGDGLVGRLTPLPDDSQMPLYQRFPPALGLDWQTYLDRFADHYQVTNEGRQRLEDKLRQRKDATVTWLLLGTKNVKKTGPSGLSVEVPMTTQERVQEYVKKRDETRAIQDKMLWTFGPDVNAKLRAAKADASRLRADLAADVKDQTTQMKAALLDILVEDHKDPKREAVLSAQDPKKYAALPEDFGVPEIDKGKPVAEPAPPIGDWNRLQWADAVVKYGLVAVGLCLLLGLFTRLACVFGAVFIAAFTIAIPPLLGLVPDNPKAEGLELFINKNIIEVLALLALATTNSGKWVGLDGLVQFLNPFGRRKTPPPPPPPEVRKDLGAETPRPDLVNGNGQEIPDVVPAERAVTPEPPEPVHTPEPRDISHGD
jgi:uncharacterized membrane protein YphA (DoxX/SURF4 family)